MREKARLIVLSTSIVLAVGGASLLLPQSAAAAEEATNPSKRLAQEWAEVKKKYPHVAIAYLRSLDARSAAGQFALNTDERAFRASQFRSPLVDLCAEEQAVRPVICDSLKVAPGIADPPCPNCKSICFGSLNPVDCTECLQKRADRGCL